MSRYRNCITRIALLVGLIIPTIVLAQETLSTSFDLYMKDRPEDYGAEQFPYDWQADRDMSVDIWLRNDQDGFENQESETLYDDNFSIVYLYVRVRNKSLVDASGNENLRLYWSKASSWSSWPQNWDGSQPTIGNLVGSVNLGNLAAGTDTIIEFPWSLFGSDLVLQSSVCFLARIEDSPTDQITIHPGRLDDDVFFNNNITMRNVSIVNIGPWIEPPGEINGVYYPHGKYMLVGNVLPHMSDFNLRFSIPDGSSEVSILRDAEVKIIFDDLGWDIVEPYLSGRSDIKILQEKEIQLLADDVLISDVEFPANTRIPIYVGFSFLIEENTGQEQFMYHVRQYLSEDNSLLGGVHYEVNRFERSPFKANAGDDKQIQGGESVDISAELINESASYNWYDQAGNLIYEGSDFSVSPEITQKFKLEVITDADGFKDYDEVEVRVNPFWLINISPNPATNHINVLYNAEEASSAYMMILDQTSTGTSNYIIDVSQTETSIDISAYEPGLYTVILICDGVARDAKNLVIH